MGKHKKNRGSRHEKLLRRFTILKSARRCFFHGLEEALQERIKDVCIRPYPFLPIFYIYMDKELIFGSFCHLSFVAKKTRGKTPFEN